VYDSKGTVTSILRAIALALIAGAACSSDATEPGASRYGRYTLRSINGNGLPAVVIESANSRLEFLSGALRLNPDQTFTDSTDLKVTPLFRGEPLAGAEIRFTTDVAYGLFRIAGDSVYFDSLRGEHYAMVFHATGSALNQDLAGSVLLYRKSGT
jgi:hypothetical protein